MEDRWIAGILGERPEPRPNLRDRILTESRRERAAFIAGRRRRYRTAWISLAACAVILLCLDVSVDRHDSARIAALMQKSPPIGTPATAAPAYVASFRMRRADLAALLRDPDPTAGAPSRLRAATAPALQ